MHTVTLTTDELNALSLWAGRQANMAVRDREAAEFEGNRVMYEVEDWRVQLFTPLSAKLELAKGKESRRD